MPTTTQLRAAPCFLVMVVAVCTAQSGPQKASLADEFRITPQHSYVYLRFDHTGESSWSNEDKPERRVWFRLVNNCRVPIIVRTFGVPEGSPQGEAGVIYDIVRTPSRPVGGAIMPSVGATPSPSESPESSETRSGPNFDVSSFESIPPGESILFSVPVSDLSEKWRMEIPYRFDLPKTKGVRDAMVGGEPKMALLYSAWDLPETVRKQLKRKP